MKITNPQNLTELLEMLKNLPEKEINPEITKKEIESKIPEKKIELEIAILEKIGKLDQVEFIQQQFKTKDISKLIIKTKNQDQVEIYLDWHVNKMIGLEIFTRVKTRIGYGVFLGRKKMDMDSLKKGVVPDLIFYIDGNKNVSYVPAVRNEKALHNQGIQALINPNNEIRKYDDRRLQRYVLTKNISKVNATLKRISELPQGKIVEIVCSERLIYSLLEADLNLLRTILDIIFYVFKREVLRKLCEELLIQSIENNNEKVVNLLLDLKKIKDLKIEFSNKEEIVTSLKKGHVSDKVMTEFVVAFWDFKEIKNINSNQFNSSDCKLIIEIAQLFYSSLQEKTDIRIIQEFLSSFSLNNFLILKLFKSIILSIPSHSGDFHSHEDYSALKLIILQLKLVCLDAKNSQHEQLAYLFRDALTSLYGIDFKEYNNKSLFQSNEEKEEFFQKELGFFLKNLPANEQGMSNFDQNTIEIDPIADALFALDLGDQSLAIKKLLKLDEKNIDSEGKNVILNLAVPSNNIAFAEAYFEKAKSLQEKLNSKSTPDELMAVMKYFSKAYLLGYKPCISNLENIEKNFTPIFKFKSLLVEFSKNLFLAREKVFYIINLKLTEKEVDSFEFITNIIIENKKITPEAVLYLGFLYSHPKFSYANSSNAYKYLKIAIQEKCEISIMNALYNYYCDSEKSFDGSKAYVGVLEFDDRIQKREEEQSGFQISETNKNIVQNFCELIKSKKLEKPKTNLKDFSNFLNEAIAALEQIVENLSTTAHAQAVILLKEGDVKKKEDYKKGLNNIELGLALTGEVIKLLTNKELKETSQEYLAQYLQIIKNEIGKHAVSNRRLLGLENKLKNLMDKYQLNDEANNLNSLSKS